MENELLTPILNNLQQEKPDPIVVWSLYVEGSTGKEHQGANFVPKTPTRTEFAYALKYIFHASNNKLEYEVLLVGLQMALAMNVDQLIIHGDSQIVHRHITDMFETKEENMKKYSKLAKALFSRLKKTQFEKLSRRNNQKADELSKSLFRDQILRIWLEQLIRKSIDKEILCVIPKTIR